MNSFINKFRKENIKYCLQRFNGIVIETDISRYKRILKKIKEIELDSLSDSDLKIMFNNLKNKISGIKKEDKYLPEVYALITEVIKRTLKVNPFDVQIIAGIAMFYGKIVQMNTGEGKTISALFPAILSALRGNSVQIMTANGYLAQRDAEYLKPVYNFFDIQSSFINENVSYNEKKIRYTSDVIYLTAKEGGYDYLRDSLCYDKNHLLQKDFNFLIIDEADFIMIDEARIPLVIAGDADNYEIDFNKILDFSENLIENIDYYIDIKNKNISFTDCGIHKITKEFSYEYNSDDENRMLLSVVNTALSAKYFYKKDKNYIIKDNKISLIDELTGRIADKRRYPYGIHNMLEAINNLDIQKEYIIKNSITLQDFIRLYPKITGMTATAADGAEDFNRIYKLPVVIIPPNKTSKRIDLEDIIYKTKFDKYNALVNEVYKVNSTGQPVLIGTESINESEIIFDLLSQKGINCVILNAKNNEKEAKIISGAGMPYSVIISTNMAGRGTDIKLGGENELFRDEVVSLGGLYVIGTTRYESARVDNQLVGRAGRQGDPGKSRFFISLEDDLFKQYNLLSIFGKDINSLNNNYSIKKEIKRAQSVISNYYSLIRQTLLKYSKIVETQRKKLFEIRKTILFNNNFEIVMEEDIIIQYKLNCENNNIREKIRLVILNEIDKFWSSHLENVERIKEGLQLQISSGIDPICDYINSVYQSFEDGFLNMRFNINKIIQSIMAEKDYYSLPVNIFYPESSYTFMIEENPFIRTNLIIRGFERIKKIVRKI